MIVPDELLRKVTEAFSDTPHRSMTHRELDAWLGQQEVIAFIKLLHTREREGQP